MKKKYCNLNTALIHSLKKKIEALKDSEKRFKELFELAPDAIFLQDTNGRFIDGNRASEKLTGYKRKELIGKDIRELKIFPPKELKKIIKELGKPNKKPKEYTLIKKNGAKVIVEVLSNLINLKEKKLILGIARDITEKKKDEEKIKIYYAAIENSNEGMVFTDMKGNILHFNNTACRIFGYSSDEMKKMNISQFSATSGQEKKLEKSVRQKGSFSGEIIGKKKNKDTFPAKLSVSIIKDESGKPIGRMGVFKDITAEKKAQNKLKIMLHNSKATNLALSRDINKRKKIEQRLKESLELNQEIIEKAPIGIYTINKKGDVDYCNPEMGKISGINKKNFIKKVKPLTLPTYKRLGLIKKIKDVFKGKSFSLGPIKYKSHYAGKETIRKFVGIPIKEKNKIKKAMIAVVDFTRVKDL